MLITRVELENIKCYRSATFEFEAGVTAVCGPNGSGKTTILEAISWVLFDHIPYKKEDFLRRGEKRGWVRVSFTSSLDGREYTVYRDTGGGYSTYDPVTKLRLAEQKSQVAAWIRQHIGVEPSVDLRALFTSAVGVPQGSFTADFADQPYKRKLEFDRVLRVDEYQRSSEELLPLVRHIEKRVADSREEIARAEGSVASLGALRDERRANEIELQRVRTGLPAAEREQSERKTELELLDRLSLELQRKTAEAQMLRSKAADGQVRLAVLQGELERSRRAEKSLRAAEAGYALYLKTLNELKGLETLSARRDALKGDLHSKEQELAVARADVGHLKEKMVSVETDRKRLADILPSIRQQESLEQRRSEIQRVIGELGELTARKESAENDIRALRQEYKKVTAALKESDSLMVLAGRMKGLTKECKEAEAEVRAAQLARSKIEERKTELERVRKDMVRLKPEILRVDREIGVAKKLEPIALSVKSLEVKESDTLDQIARIQARLESDRSALAEIKEGLCPLLSQRCLNMKNGETLDQYFKVKVESESERLNGLMEQRNELHASLSDARSAHSVWLTLESLGHQRERMAKENGALKSRFEELESEISRVTEVEAALNKASAKLAAAGDALRVAQDAKVKHEMLVTQKERLEQVREEGIEKRKLVEDLSRRISDSSGAAAGLARVEDEIAILGDPRGSARILEENIAKESTLKDTLARRQAGHDELKRKVAALKTELSSFEELDEQLSSKRETLLNTEGDYHAFNENKSAADMLADRQREHDSANANFAADQTRLQLLSAELEADRTKYDADRHERLRALLEESTSRVARLSFELSRLEERKAELESRVEQLEEIANRVAELSEKKRRSEEMLSTSELIRELLRKAGPFITEAHLSSISIEANQLYRDVTGNQIATLRWDSGYEIVLEEDGYDRTFASLSGGEQMVAALAVRLALLKELSEVRVAFFDEPTSSVDELRRRNLAEQIGRIKDFDQLFVISHDDAFEGYTDHVISLGREH